MSGHGPVAAYFTANQRAAIVILPAIEPGAAASVPNRRTVKFRQAMESLKNAIPVARSTG
jgi:hypothetical protein